jgi:hypothetical protein
MILGELRRVLVHRTTTNYTAIASSFVYLLSPLWNKYSISYHVTGTIYGHVAVSAPPLSMTAYSLTLGTLVTPVNETVMGH